MNKRSAFEIIFLIFLFLLSPFIAVLLSIYFIYADRHIKESSVIFILFWGLIGYTYLPFDSMDITRHNLSFEQLKSIDSLLEFITYQSMSEKPDIALDIVFWGIGKWIKTHQIVGFLGAICYYGLGLGILLHWRENLRSKSSFNNFLLPLLMFLAMAQVTEFSVMRQGNATLLFLYIITFSDEKISSLKKCMLLIFPCLIHFSMYPLALLYIFTCIFNRKYLFIISIFMLVSYFFFIPLMSLLMDLLAGLGGIGAGISEKIDDYIFGGEVEVKLYSGSVLRFYVIILMMLFFPFIAFRVDRMREKLPKFILHFHYWGILFFSYTLLTSSSYILSRNMVMFKMFSVLYFTYALFSCSYYFSRHLQRLLVCLCLIIALSGPFSMWLGEEYRVLNPEIFYSNVINILSIKTLPEGY